MTFESMGDVDLEKMMRSASMSNARVRFEWPGAFTCSKVPVFDPKLKKPCRRKIDEKRDAFTREINEYISTLEPGRTFTATDIANAVGRSARVVGRCVSRKRLHLFDVDVMASNCKSNRIFIKKGNDK